ncbi:MFS transporter [Microbacteriaceae bacterium 4G12]
MEENYTEPSTTGYSNRWLALFVLLLGTFMVILDSFIVNVAIPTIQEQLHASATQIQFIVVAYVLSYAVLLIMGARIGDKLGRKKIFIIGMSMFVLASAMCGMAPNTIFLISSRIIQGIGAALLIPQVLSIIQVIFPPGEQARAIGLYGAVSGLGLVAGQIIGGILLHLNVWGLGWRSVFLINIPIGILAVLLIIPLIPEIRSKEEKGMDWIGMILLTCSMLLLVYPLVTGRESGWPLWIYISFIGSFLLLMLFLSYEKKMVQNGKNPLIPVAIFGDRSFSVGILTILAYQIGSGGFFLIVSITLQDGLLLSAMESALAFTPIGGAFFLACLLAPKWSIKKDGAPLKWGSLILIIGYMTTIAVTYYFGKQLYWQELIIPFSLIGFGQGLVAAPLMGTILSGVRSEYVGSASGIVNTFMQLGNVFGIATIGTVYFSVITMQKERHSGHLGMESYLNSFDWALLCSMSLAIVTFILIFYLCAQRKKAKQQAAALSNQVE